MVESGTVAKSAESNGGKSARITATRFLTGSYVTSLDMAGVSITASVLDGQAKELWDAPVHTAALRWGT